MELDLPAHVPTDSVQSSGSCRPAEKLRRRSGNRLRPSTGPSITVVPGRFAKNTAVQRQLPRARPHLLLTTYFMF